ncbi:MAG: DNA polymerase III subunit delta [Candidatus Scalinduaceae bacterium]
MKFAEFAYKSKDILKYPFYIISGNEYFLKQQTLAKIKKRFFSEGGTEQGFLEFNSKDVAGNAVTERVEEERTKTYILSFNHILDEVRTTSMFGKHKLVIVKNADNFLSRYQDKLLEYIKNPYNTNWLILDVLSIDKRTKLAKALDNKRGILIECNRLYDSPAPWEKNKPEYDSEITRWVAMHVKSYNKMMNLKTAFYLLEKTGNNLAIIDKQIDVLSIYIGNRNEITIEDIQKLLGISHREKLYNLLDAIGMKDASLAIKVTKNIFDNGMENENKNITYDEKSIAIIMINSIHKRMRDLWKALKILDKGGSKEDILKNVSVRRPFIDKFLNEAHNFVEEEMPEKWKDMLEADLLCKTSRLSPPLIIEQLITKLCN